MPEEIVFALPVIAAGIGWITNFLAVKMLFHPKSEVKLLGLRIQGVFTKRQAALAQKLGDIVSEELFSIKEVTGKIENMATSEDFLKSLSGKVEKSRSFSFCLKKFISSMPISGFVDFTTFPPTISPSN